MKRILLFSIFFGLALIAHAQNTSPILANYLKLKDALVASDVTKSTQAVAELSKSIDASPEFSQKNDLKKQVAVMAKTTDLEKQRAAFADVSTTIWGAAKGQKWDNQELFYQYCPMKKTYWLSTESAIKNPYYGSKMLACGSVKETLPKKD
jgi:hypothetical protein